MIIIFKDKSFQILLFSNHKKIFLQNLYLLSEYCYDNYFQRRVLSNTIIFKSQKKSSYKIYIYIIRMLLQ